MFSTDYTGNFVEKVAKRLLIHYPSIKFSIYDKGVSGNKVKDCL